MQGPSGGGGGGSGSGSSAGDGSRGGHASTPKLVYDHDAYLAEQDDDEYAPSWLANLDAEAVAALKAASIPDGEEAEIPVGTQVQLHGLSPSHAEHEGQYGKVVKSYGNNKYAVRLVNGKGPFKVRRAWGSHVKLICL